MRTTRKWHFLQNFFAKNHEIEFFEIFFRLKFSMSRNLQKNNKTSPYGQLAKLEAPRTSVCRCKAIQIVEKS